MKKHSDKKVIYAALIGNSAIAVMKFIIADRREGGKGSDQKGSEAISRASVMARTR
jgi:hypothetical protein